MGSLEALLLVLATAASAAELPPGDRASVAIGEYGSRLKGELTTAMEGGGAIAAIDVCHTRAAEIAAAVGRELGVQVGRTALRVRNPANRPDAWEQGVLERFQAELAAGAPPEMLFAVASEASPEGTRHRYMAPIVTQPPCLACHGSTLAPGVRQALEGHYPDDQATGFRVGELRGAFSVEWLRP